MDIDIQYIHVKNNSNKLLIFFNDMVKVGMTDNTFSSFKILSDTFDDYDILFIKDIKYMYWYLSIINDIYSLIDNIIQSNNYNFMYGLTSSSGALCLLNTLYKFNIFKQAVIINGQTTMCDDIVNKYKYSCGDCCVFNKQCINEPYDDDFITPFKKIPNEMLDKYIFYYCNSVSDLIYYEYIKSIYPENLYSNIFFDITNNSHGGYIAYLLNNNNFLLNIKNIFDASASNGVYIPA
jgi:hypothetical protein